MSSHPVIVTFDEDDQTLLAKWTINNFSSLSAERVESQLFSHESSKEKWRLALTRNFVEDDIRCVKVSIYTVAPAEVRVQLYMCFDLEFGETEIDKNCEAKHISPKGLYITDALLDYEDIGDYLKPDGSLAFSVWMDYSTLTCDHDWFNTRLALSDGLGQALNGKYSDITFKVDNMTIKAHIIIVSRCKYFETMLDGNNNETNTGVIEITDFKFAVVRGLLEYIYSGWIDLMSVNFAISLRMAADKYDLPGLVVRCEDHIAWRMKPRHVTKAILSTTVLESLKIKKACAKIIRSHPKDINNCGDIFDNEELRVYLMKCKFDTSY